MTKLELELYYVMTNSYTKFQVYILKDSRENAEQTDRRNDGLTVGRTDRRQAN